jgi:hypothetical protein
MRAFPLIALAAALSFVPGTAKAQSWAMHGQIGLGTGMEGGTPGDSGVAWHLARLRATAGLDVAADEAAYQAFGVRAFVEFQRATSVGAALHYNIAVSKNFGLFAELTGVIAPRTLFGAGAGGTFVIPMGDKLGIFIEPELAALPVGSDVPKDSVIIWALLSVGLRFNL